MRRPPAPVLRLGVVALVCWAAFADSRLRGQDQSKGTRATPTITEFALPALPANVDRSLGGITAGPDGNIWFTEFLSSTDPARDFKDSRIGRITPAGSIQYYYLPWKDAAPGAITAASDGLWFTSGRPSIGFLDYVGGGVTEVAIPSGRRGTSIITGPDGNVWFVVSASVGLYDVQNGGVKEFATPLAWIGAIAAGPDGNLWATDPTLDVSILDPPRIAKIDLATGQSSYCYTCTGFDDNPSGLTLGPDGNLWFTGNIWSHIGRIDFMDGKPVGSRRWNVAGTRTNHITGGPDGNLWFTSTTGSSVGYATPSGAITEIRLSQYGNPGAVTAGADGNVWFVIGGANGRIGRINLGLGTRYTVNSTGDADDEVVGDGRCSTGTVLSNGLVECTLRAAIEQADGHAGPDIIAFSVPGQKAPVIAPTRPLPIVGDSVTIDGTTQPGGGKVIISGARLIPPDDTSATELRRLVGLHLMTTDSIVRGLVIHSWPYAGLLLRGGGRHRIEGNYIGTDAIGTGVGGNGSTSRPFLGWGNDATGGLLIIDSAANTIGGHTESARNVISGNLPVFPSYERGSDLYSGGILISGKLAVGNVIQGNYIGISATQGTVPQGFGIRVYDAPGNTIGGYWQPFRNIISANRVGIAISGADASANVVQGNFIGTDLRGTASFANGTGIVLSAPGNTIGGADYGYGNLISGNGRGITINGESGRDNVIQGNYIGTGAFGTGAIGNRLTGISIDGDARRNLIGGTKSGAANIIAHTGMTSGVNGGEAILVAGGMGNRALGNAIFGNRKMGIDLTRAANDSVDLQGDGPNPMDVNSAIATGPNRGQPYPQIEFATRYAGQEKIRIKGNLWNSSGTNPYRLEFYLNSKCGMSDYGEGEELLGALEMSTFLGTLDFDASFIRDPALPARAAPGNFLTVTATDADGNTSEFSRCVQIKSDASGSDADGVGDAIENGAANNGDGNRDGVADALQSNVASLPGFSGKYVTLAAPGGSSLLNVEAVGRPADTSASLSFPTGFLKFSLSGFTSRPGARDASTTVTMFLPAGTSVRSYRNYGPTPDNTSPHYYDFLFDGSTGAELFADRIVLHFLDGARGDHDLAANGVIQTLGAPVNFEEVSLTVSVTGPGTGQVTTTASSTSCGDSCVTKAVAGSVVTLAARPSPDSSFGGWSGDADCADGKVTLNAATSCTARFVPLPRYADADFNRDGIGDALLYNATSGQWVQTLAKGGGGFDYRGGAWSAGWVLRSGDFNGDGLTDLLLYDPASGTFFTAVNNGAGEFAYARGTWSPDWSVYVVDLDGDGRSDVFLYNVVTGDWFRAVAVGDGFAYTQGKWSSGWEVYPLSANGDAATDFFLYNSRSGQWSMAANDRTFGFSYVGGAWSGGWQIHPGDFNGDGRTDLLLYDATTGGWYTCLNTGDGSGFSYAAGQWSGAWTVAVGRFDEDGRADVFLYNKSSGQWAEALSDGAGGFRATGGSWSGGWQLFPADFSRDGRTDLLLYNAATGAWFQAVSGAAGTFTYVGGGWDARWSILTGR